jgi:hypothetical protein
MSEPLISPALAPIVGGVLAGLTTLGIRMFVDPVTKENKVSDAWRWAPAIGAGVGAVVGGGAAYYLGNEDWMSALGAAGGAAIATAPMLAQEVYHRSVAKDAATVPEAATKWANIQRALSEVSSGAAALTTTTTDAGAGAGTNGVGQMPSRAWGTNPMYTQ